MNDLIQMGFFQRAMLAGLLVGFLGSFYGAFVVQRRMSFLGDGLAHAAFGGVALGLLLQTNPMWVAIPATILVSVGITFLKDKTGLETDTSIGIFFAVSMALGVIFLSLKKDYSIDAFSYLFGSILTVQHEDLIYSGLFALVTIVISSRYWRRWAYTTFDRDLAESDRISVLKEDYLLSICISLTIVLSIKLVGIVLIASFLVIPAASARLISPTFFRMTIYSIIAGIFSSIAGLFISLLANLPSGAVIILVQAVLFILAVTAKRVFFK